MTQSRQTEDHSGDETLTLPASKDQIGILRRQQRSGKKPRRNKKQHQAVQMRLFGVRSGSRGSQNDTEVQRTRPGMCLLSSTMRKLLLTRVTPVSVGM